MSMRKVARLAGVSLSTVSRVVNGRSNVAGPTADSVRRAMHDLGMTADSLCRARAASRNETVAFLVLGTAGTEPAPAFQQLLSGVHAAAEENDLSLIFSFVSDPTQLPPRLTERKVAGLLVHGNTPAASLKARLRALPTVWLMANRQRPDWGDQVLPDNSAIGEMAAQYLVERGHQRVAYLGAGCGLWGMEIRCRAFARAAAEGGAQVDVLEFADEQNGDLWGREGLLAGRTLVDRLMQLEERPTGLFVSEDRLLPSIDAALMANGLRTGPGGDVELISCNNERPHVAQLRYPPAEIDIRVESIGRRAVELLVWRLENRQISSERIRAMVEPVLVEPPASPKVIAMVDAIGIASARVNKPSFSSEPLALSPRGQS